MKKSAESSKWYLYFKNRIFIYGEFNYDNWCKKVDDISPEI